MNFESFNSEQQRQLAERTRQERHRLTSTEVAVFGGWLLLLVFLMLADVLAQAPQPVVVPDTTAQVVQSVPLDKLTRLEIENALLRIEALKAEALKPFMKRIEELETAAQKAVGEFAVSSKLNPADWYLDIASWTLKRRQPQR